MENQEQQEQKEQKGKQEIKKTDSNVEVSEGKTLAIVSYLTIIGTLIAFFLNNSKKNSFAAFHIRQALGLNITYFVLGFVVSYFNSWIISSVFMVFFAVLYILGIYNAATEKEKELPVLGSLYSNWFKSVGA